MTIFLFLILNIINFIHVLNSKILTLTLYENTYIKNTYNVSLLNVKDAIIKSSPSKLAYITDINDKDKDIYNIYSKIFNRIWLFYIDTLEQIYSVLGKDFSDYDITITGLLIPKSLKYNITKDNNNNKEVPILEIDDNITEPMGQYDIRQYNKNIYFKIEGGDVLLIPLGYIIAFSLFVLLSSIVISITWNIIEKKVGQNYVFGYHERIKYIFCAHIFLALTLIFKTVSLMRAENYELNATVEVSLTLSSSFFRSLLWFLIYLIGYGWQICFQELIMTEQKKMVKIFICFVINFWIDDILEKYFDLIWIFHLSEIKNIGVYILLTILIVRNINKNIILLNRKYNYALSLIPDFVDGILSKIKLMSSLKKIILSYLPLYILILLIHKIFLFDYDVYLLITFDYLVPDIILEFIFLFLMRPKIVPDFYNVDLGDIFNDEEGNTYKCCLPKFDERFKLDNQEIKINKKDYDTDEIPIIIIGPNQTNIDVVNMDLDSNDDSEENEIKENDINKYFSNIQIGYYNSNK